MIYGIGRVSIIFSFTFLLVAAIIVVVIVRSVDEWHRNNNSPRLTVDAVVVDRKKIVQHETRANAGDVTGAHGYHTTTSVTYSVIFQVESGDQMKFVVNGNVYEMLQEGMQGRLTFQGSRYLGFEKSA